MQHIIHEIFSIVDIKIKQNNLHLVAPTAHYDFTFSLGMAKTYIDFSHENYSFKNLDTRALNFLMVLAK